MRLSLLFDSLLVAPLLTAMTLAVLLPVLGVLLRLRGEWLAAFGYAHVSAAGALIGLAGSWPAMAGGGIAALLACSAKARFGARGNSAYGLMVVAGWTLMMLVAANTTLGSALGHALIEGQVFLARGAELAAAAVLTATGLLVLAVITPRLVRARLLPELERANGEPAWRWHFAFDTLVAVAMAVATATLGLMAAFALVFLPPIAAFPAAPSLRAAFILSAVLGMTGFAIAFPVSVLLDQPFGPVLSASALALATVAGVITCRRPQRAAG